MHKTFLFESLEIRFRSEGMDLDGRTMMNFKEVGWKSVSTMEGAEFLHWLGDCQLLKEEL
jgi:hypothetical protein